MKTREEIMKLMEEKAKNLKSQKHNANIEKDVCDCNTPKYWENTTPSFLDEEEFRIVHKVGNFNKYCYYISNLGRVMVVKDSSGEWENKTVINKKTNFDWKNCWLIPVKDGYLSEKAKNIVIDDENSITLSTLTDVYKFMMETDWLDTDPKNQKAKEKANEIVEYNKKNNTDSNDRVELHHIDNNPSNNCVDNLIWVPKSIHQTLHEK